MREFCNRGTGANDAMTARQPEQLLELAKWPEQEEQVWDVSRWDEIQRNEPQPPVTGGKEPAQARDRAPRDIFGRGQSPSHGINAGGGQESGNHAAMIAAGVLTGLLMIGVGIYAYETSSALPPPAAATRAPTPANSAIVLPSAAATPRTSRPSILPMPHATAAGPSTVAPPAAAPDTAGSPASDNSPTPGSAANASRAASQRPTARAADDPINAPMTLTPETAPPPQQSAAAGLLAGDPADAPMTLTPQTAPPPQPPAPAVQTAPPASPGQTSLPAAR